MVNQCLLHAILFRDISPLLLKNSISNTKPGKNPLGPSNVHKYFDLLLGIGGGGGGGPLNCGGFGGLSDEK